MSYTAELSETDDSTESRKLQTSIERAGELDLSLQFPATILPADTELWLTLISRDAGRIECGPDHPLLAHARPQTLLEDAITELEQDVTAEDVNAALKAAADGELAGLYELVRDHKVARVRDIARARGVRSASVTPAMRRLAQMGLIR